MPGGRAKAPWLLPLPATIDGKLCQDNRSPIAIDTFRQRIRAPNKEEKMEAINVTLTSSPGVLQR